MQLPGRLAESTLGDVLGTLHRAGATGILELIEMRGPSAGRSHRISLKGGLVAAVDTPLAGPKLGEILARRGELSPDEASGLGRTGELVGKELLSRRLVAPSQIAEALHEQLRERIDGLFRFEDARIRFRVPRPDRFDVTRPEPLAASEFLHGRPRARGRRKRALDVGPPGRSAFEVLGLKPNATQADVRKAFRRLAAESHPDRFPRVTVDERTRLMRRFAELTSAYHELIA